MPFRTALHGIALCAAGNAASFKTKKGLCSFEKKKKTPNRVALQPSNQGLQLNKKSNMSSVFRQKVLIGTPVLGKIQKTETKRDMSHYIIRK